MLAVAAGQAEARELLLSVDSNIGGDSNVFRRSAKERSDGLFEFSPRALVRDTRDTLEYEFSYRPTYQAYFKSSSIRGLDHNGRGNLTWSPTKQNQFLAGGSIVSSRIVRQFLDTVPAFVPTDPDELILDESDSDRTIRARASAGYSRSFGQAQSARINFSFNDTNFQDGINIDSRSYSAVAGTTRILNERTQVGLSVTGRRREGFGNANQFSTKTKTGEISLSLVYALTPTLTLSAQGGPSFTRTKQIAADGGDANPVTTTVIERSVSSNDISFVADVSLMKQFQRSTISLQYSRFESGSGGSSSTSIVDSGTLSIGHRPSREWDLQLSLGFTNREQFSAVNELAGAKLQRYSISASAAYKISRQISLVGRTYYQRFENTTRNFSPTPIPNFTDSTQITDVIFGSVTFRYSFDPIPF